MTAKRFTLNSVLNFDFGICDYGEPIGSLRNICELLNELHEENEHLRKQVEEGIDAFKECQRRLAGFYDDCETIYCG